MPSGGSLKPYYISLDIANEGYQKLSLRFLENGQEKDLPVEPRTSVNYQTSVMASTTPAPIEFKAYVFGTSSPIPINGQPLVEIDPTESLRTVSLKLGEAGEQSLIIFETLFFVQIGGFFVVN